MVVNYKKILSVTIVDFRSSDARSFFLITRFIGKSVYCLKFGRQSSICRVIVKCRCSTYTDSQIYNDVYTTTSLVGWRPGPVELRLNHYISLHFPLFLFPSLSLCFSRTERVQLCDIKVGAGDDLRRNSQLRRPIPYVLVSFKIQLFNIYRMLPKHIL